MTRRMPSYKLTYFDLKGLGEPIRFILSYMGKDFEDNRVRLDEWQSALKAKTLYGKLPVLEIDGKPYYQSQAILRLLAKEAKLAGDDDQEAYEIDSVAQSITDLMTPLSTRWGITDPAEKEKAKNKLNTETIPYYMKIWDDIAGKNRGFLAVGRLSWADLLFHGWIETVEGIVGEQFVNNYANLKAGREKVYGTRGIKEWIAKRPKTAL